MTEQNLLQICEVTYQKIGQDLHDDIGQQITGIAFLFEVLKKDLINEGYGVSEDAQTITNRLSQVATSLRKLSHGLCPISVDSNNLITLMQFLADETTGLFGVTCKFTFDKDSAANGYFDSRYLPKNEFYIQLFRIVQETISNAIKQDHANSGIGLLSMASSASMLSVDIAFIDLEMGGTRVSLCLPNAFE